jgi:SPX domain protein involved in polyphosphate accumulation
MDYDGLKRYLKERGSFSDQDEANFVEYLEKELDKVTPLPASSIQHHQKHELKRSHV